MKTKQKMLRGWCSWWVLPGFGNLLNQICSGVYDVDLLGLFLRFFTTSFELRAVDRSVSCHLSETCSSSSSIHITQSPPSPLSKPPPSSRLRVPFFVSCVMSIYLSIDLSVHFLPGLLLIAAAASCWWVHLLYHCCYNFCRHIIT